MSEDNIIVGWHREGPDAKIHVLNLKQRNTIDECDAGFDEGYIAPPGTEPKATGKPRPTPYEIGFDRGLEIGLRHTAHVEMSRHPSAQVRGRK